MISGSSGIRGCKKGENCAFFHPDICKVTVESGSCSKKDCKNFHPRVFRKKNNSGPKYGSRNAAQKVVKQNNDNTSNPSSNDFLELRNLVTGMAAKLEMLKKKMDQGTPACQPTMQPASPTMIYPTAPIPPTHDASRSVQAITSPHSLLSSLLLLNARSLNPSANSASRWKLHDLIGHIEEKRQSGQLFPFIAITESWLKSYFTDAHIRFQDTLFNDVIAAKRTVVGFYSICCHLSQSQLQSFDDGTCQGLCNIYPSAKLLVAVIHRPESF